MNEPFDSTYIGQGVRINADLIGGYYHFAIWPYVIPLISNTSNRFKWLVSFLFIRRLQIAKERSLFTTTIEREPNTNKRKCIVFIQLFTPELRLFGWSPTKVFVLNFISKPTRNNEIRVVQSIGSYKIVRSDFWFAIAYFWHIILTSTETKGKNEKSFVKYSRQNTNKRTPNISIQRANHASNKQGKHFVGQYNSGEGRRI